MTIDLADMPHAPQIGHRLAQLSIRMPVGVDERDDCVAGETPDSVPKPLARNEERAADVEAEGIVLERCAVPVTHEETDQAGIRLAHLGDATAEADPRRVDDREVIRHRVVEPDETVVENWD
ncbi:MAG TPA: hypothetical protein VGQ84_01940 [Gaiellaceae bacterium]|nr:hypothetical protein [Gaiellaceae bacterium]